ncbi:putative methyltransferase PMT21 [Cocos nucifera]|nr:putative methyltransferase PMT21 [Cocos nucifera]
MAKKHVKHSGKKVVEAFKTSKDFRFELAEGAMFAYHIGFKESLRKVKKSFPKADLSQITPSMPEMNGGNEE